MFVSPIPAPNPSDCAFSDAVENPGTSACSMSAIPGPRSVAATDTHASAAQTDSSPEIAWITMFISAS
jgi:hypothetical protein